ncbi:Methyltransf_26 domain-containing protein [Cephalotus follicularis]|uniref:Methyltransf_26 domain-containing protein n=1 Tax=Cephalotus follicularis TaxID=3775 RepID=A0A1Q3CEK5_CEPFO|nr:Methyltransf_26 domain-containing protein [Cephalotus follicularis]
MRPSLARVYRIKSFTLIFQHKPSFVAANHHQRTPIYFSSLSSSCPNLQIRKPQTPLFLRAASYSATLPDLKKWHQWATSLASSVGSTLVDLDNGPDSTLLLRELNWLIQDSFQDHHNSFIPQLPTTEFTRTRVDSQVVKLRVGLDELYRLWRQRVEERRPFQYIVGCEHWRDLVLSVEDGVLVPRPETELIVDLVSNVLLKESNRGLRDGLWADLGTGSGALAIAIGRLLGKHGRVIATDLSPVAVAVATFNVQRYALQDVVDVRQGSWFEPLKDLEGKLGGIISNPPYIPSNHISGLQAEVGRHEPRLALDGGFNGMDDLLHICNGAASFLKPAGFFAFETNGLEQCKFLVDYMDRNIKGSICNVSIVSDFAGIPRFVTGFRQ